MNNAIKDSTINHALVNNEILSYKLRYTLVEEYGNNLFKDKNSITNIAIIVTRRINEFTTIFNFLDLYNLLFGFILFLPSDNISDTSDFMSAKKYKIV